MSAIAPLPATSTRQAEAIRTLIVDDSVVVRTVIERILNDHPDFVVAQKTNMAEHALRYLADNSVDLILLDIELPGQSGLAALPAILRLNPQAKILILSGNCEEGSAEAIEALALGASDILSKPGSGSFGENFPLALIERVSRLFGRHPSLPASTALAAVSPRAPARVPAPLGCLGIGASTGGIHALGQLFGGRAAPLGVPILVTQHLPLSFTVYFAQQMSRMTPLRVKVAEQGEVLAPDIVYIAPGDANLLCRRGLHGRVTVSLDPRRTPTGHLPGVDPMFAAMAQAYGPCAAGIVLTGMGRDGTRGAQAIVDAGGWIVAQDEASSVVWGMPRSVAEAGLSCGVMAPGAIMPFVTLRAKGLD
jgi:two-component system chemotaxis response regulator CheB